MIKNKTDLKLYLKLDEQALGIKRNLIKDFLFPNQIWKFQKLLRHLEYYTNVPSLSHKLLRLITWYRFRKISMKLGFSIPVNVFGPGLSIAHYGTIVVNSQAKIGSFCRLHACVNIGASAGSKKAPVIGNNCYIGPGVILFGNIQIADNVTIGANATVNKDCLTQNSVIAGTPAKIVKENAESWVSFNKIKTE